VGKGLLVLCARRDEWCCGLRIYIGRETLRAVRIAGCLRVGCEYPTRIHSPNFPKKRKTKCGGENIITEGSYSRIHFRAKVPMVTYENRSPILTEFFTSSGTSGGEPKLLPSVEDEADRRQLLGRRMLYSGSLLYMLGRGCQILSRHEREKGCGTHLRGSWDPAWVLVTAWSP
jgi:hypothetical protein